MAKLRTPIALIILIGLAASLSYCRKTKNRSLEMLDNDSAVIKHFDFMPGTYWIYKDAKSGRIDSFYVRSNVYTNVTETYDILQYHFITIAELNVDNSAPGDSANWVFNYQANDIMLDYDYTTFAWGWQNEIEFRPLLLYPYQYGSQQALYDSAVVTQIDSALEINGQVFYNVAQVYHLANPPANSNANMTQLQDLFYINDSVGMVEMTLNHPLQNINRDWQILRYKIVKPKF